MRVSMKFTFLMVALLVLAGLACGGSFSTANISEANLSRDEAGQEPTTVFDPADTFYLQVELANAPDSTTVKVVWTAVAVAGEEPNLYLDETTLTSGDGTLVFNLTNDQLWPAGEYKVDLYLNDTLDRTLTFTVP
jgi:hypothetical protein